MRKAIIIQARSGSKRYKNKILKKINHLNVLEYLIKKLLKYFKKEEIIIATTCKKEDLRICDIAKSNNVYFFQGNENDLVNRYYNCAKKFEISTIIRITSDCPLVDPNLIKKMIRIFKQKKLDYFSNTCPPGLSKFPDGSDIEIFTIKSIKKLDQLNQSKSDKEHIYGFWKKKKIFKSMILNKKNDISKFKFSLDYKSDLVLIKKILMQLKLLKIEGSADEIVNLIKKNSTLSEISKNNRLKYLKNKKFKNISF